MRGTMDIHGVKGLRVSRDLADIKAISIEILTDDEDDRFEISLYGMSAETRGRLWNLLADDKSISKDIGELLGLDEHQTDLEEAILAASETTPEEAA